jgi:hypothetical protein
MRFVDEPGAGVYILQEQKHLIPYGTLEEKL